MAQNELLIEEKKSLQTEITQWQTRVQNLLVFYLLYYLFYYISIKRININE